MHDMREMTRWNGVKRHECFGHKIMVIEYILERKFRFDILFVKIGAWVNEQLNFKIYYNKEKTMNSRIRKMSLRR